MVTASGDRVPEGHPDLMSFASGPCVIHGGYFAYDPELVPTVLIDPYTGRPPDVDETGQRCEPSPEAVARSLREPYCPGCARRLNAEAVRLGYDPVFDETDTAAALRRG